MSDGPKVLQKIGLVRPLATAIGLLLSTPRSGRAAEPPPASRKLADAITVAEGPCLSARALLPLIANWLGRSEIDARLQGAVRSEGNEIVFRLRREGTVLGERRFPLRGDSCPTLLAAVSLAIAVSIDATRLESLGLVSSGTLPAPAPAANPMPSSPGPAETPPLKSSEPSRARVGISAFAQGFVLFAILPKTAVGARLGAGAAFAWFEVQGSGFLTATVTEPLASGAADMTLAAGQLDLCVARPSMAAHPRACAGASYGRTSVRGQGFDPAALDISARWSALSLHLDARLFAFSVWQISLGADVYFALPTRLGVLSADGRIVQEKDLGRLGVALGAGPSFTF